MANQELQDQIKKIVEDELNKEGNVVAKLQQRLERKRSYDQTEFDKKGHDEQFKHTINVLETVDDALDALEKGDNNSATGFMKQGKKLLEDRISIIKLADKEGWGVVKHYKQNLLLSTGDLSEKHLKEARKSFEQFRSRIETEKKAHKESSFTQSLDEIQCFNCRRMGHYASYCPLVQKEQPQVPVSSKTSSSSSSSTSKHKSSSSKSGKRN